jgi:divalent metal cation (Fe/Co/Zn/Cd) transporter
VREIHNLNVVSVDGRVEVSLHLKLPGELSLEEAHAIATEVERAIEEELPEVDSVQTHLEPLTMEAAASLPAAESVAAGRETIRRAVQEAIGEPPRELRFLDTPDGLVAFLTIGVDARAPLSSAHSVASEIEQRIRAERPEIADVIVHTEP